MIPSDTTTRYGTIEEDWELSKVAEIHYEYDHGALLAMRKTSFAHNELMLNTTFALKQTAKGRTCKVSAETMALELEKDQRCVLPDVVITCDERDLTATDTLKHPFLVIEVTSPSTKQSDRDTKFRAYLALPSLQDYLLFSPDERL